MSHRCSHRSHTRASSGGSAAPTAVPSAFETVQSTTSTSAVDGMVTLLWSPLQNAISLPPAEFVPTHDGVLALILEELNALQCRLTTDIWLPPMLSITGSP